MKKIIKKIGLILLITITAFFTLLGLAYVVFIYDSYDGAKSKTIAPLSTENFSSIDVSKFENSEGTEYFFLVKAYTDCMITIGRDCYGKEHSPLFASTLDRETGDVYRKNLPKAPKRIRDRDRTYRGSNVSKDNGLYSILYTLTELTGDKRYAQEADKTIKWFFDNCQNPETGFLAWGEHIGCDFFKEEPIKSNTQYWLNEYKSFSYWDRAWELAPEASEKYPLALWNNQIYAHEGPDTGEFSRHASFYHHRTGKGRAFPGHGGNYINIWTKAYQKTGNKEFLTAIETLFSYYERNTTDKGTILYASDFPEQYSLSQSMNFATNHYRARDFMPENFANRMKKMADGTDSLYLSYGFDPSENGIGFLKTANLFTLEPGKFRYEHNGTNPWTKMWSAGYGAGGNSSQANSCYASYKQTGIEEYKILFLKSAEAYHKQDIPPAKVLYHGNYSSLFGMMKNAYKLTGEERFLIKAKTNIDQGVETFLDDKSPLPKASNQSEHYEAITGSPKLMQNLLSFCMEMNHLGNNEESEIEIGED